MSYVWPDQLDRFERLAAAIEIAGRVPAALERADAPDWVAARLDATASGQATVVVHSIVLQYLTHSARERFRGALGTLPADVAVLNGGRPDKDGVVRLTLREGRNRQVRRMLEAVGHPVQVLKRTRIGPISDRQLKPGA
jgi:hypothetical protein